MTGAIERLSAALAGRCRLERAGSSVEGGFVTFDDRLCDAARREGFSIPDTRGSRDP
jgi:hypothetical protein